MYSKEMMTRYTLYRSCTVLGDFRCLEAAMVATGVIGIRFEQINPKIWISERNGQARYLIQKEERKAGD